MDFFFGAIAGLVGVGISHPFDTAKTHLQKNLPIPKSIPALYRGIIPPMIGVSLEKSCVFGPYHYMMRKMNNMNPDYKYLNTMISGCFAGLTASVVVTPFERVKIQLQQRIPLKQILQPKHMFNGLSATFSRETPGFGIYFTAYESLKDIFYPERPIDLTASFCFGGVAGCFSWIFIYPQDRIKTEMQSTNGSFSKAFSEVIRSGNMYRGFSYALMRAVPMHAGAFCTYELLKRLFINS